MTQKIDDLARQNAAFFDEEEPEGQSGPEVAEQEVDFIVRNIDLKQGSSVLDVPCGEGHHSQILAEKYACEVVGIDGGPKLIERAGQKYSKPKFINAYFEDLAGVDLVDNECKDVVMCINHSFGYLPTIRGNEEFLTNMYKKLKSGGALVIQTDFNPVHPSRQSNGKLASGEVRKEGKMVYFDDNDGPDVESSLPGEYEFALDDEAFRNLEVTNSARIREDGSYGPRKKYANYLVVKPDENPDLASRKPVDMPVLRSLARHAGINDDKIQFCFEPYVDGGRTFYHCMMVMRKSGVDGALIDGISNQVSGAALDVSR